MSTMMVLEQRKHDLRVSVGKSTKADGRKVMTAQKVWHKIIECQNAERYLRRA